MEQLSLAFVVPIAGIDAVLGRKPQTKIATAVKAAIKEPAVHPVWPQLKIDVPNGEVAKFKANIAAIKLVKTLETENRQPTAEEVVVLNQYSGWGGLGRHFTDWNWRDRINELKALLSAEELDQIQSSVLNAHYTPGNVIGALWDIVARLGFKGGRILDPSAGTGFFIGAMPKAIAERSEVTAVEIDRISAAICNKLYGGYGAKVIHSPLEEADLLDGMYDLAISNVPFGNFGVVDNRQSPYRHFHIHDWFFAKALELVRPGGLVVFVTSVFTMDKKADAVRRYLAERARFIGAFRLPNSTLKQVAGCEVTTDVIVLQRLAEGIAPNPEDWVGTTALKGQLAGQHINDWYEANPQRIAGKLGMVKAAYAETLGVTFEGDLDAAIAKQVGYFDESGKVYEPLAASGAPHHAPVRRVAFDGTEASLLPGSYVAREDGIWVKEAADLVATTLKGKTAERVTGMIAVRDVARELVAAQVSDVAGEAALIRLREKLNAAYDDFVRRFGFLSEQANARAFSGDPSVPLLLSLEKRDGATGKMLKADLFTRRTAGLPPRLERCDSTSDAALAVLDETGSMDVDAIAELLQVDCDVARWRLLDEGLAYTNPKTGRLEQSDLYLSGNVRLKLREAEAAGKGYESNVTALRAVIPQDLVPTDIDAALGSVWIPETDYEQWLFEVMRPKNGANYTAASVRRSSATGAWSVSGGSRYMQTEGMRKYSTTRFDAYALVELALNQQVPTAYDTVLGTDGKEKRVVNSRETLAARATQEQLKAAFAEWVWSDPERASRLARVYNDTFNNIVPWEPKGDHLTLPGFTHFVKLRGHQKNGIWRIVSGDRNALLAHVVGAGKTLTMICAAMELRRLGRIAKPVFVVPNNTLEQFGSEFVKAYPNANVLIAGKKDFEGPKRRTLLARIATGNWDGVVLTHSMFERIKLAKSYVEAYIRGVVADIEAELSENEDGKDMTFKELRRQLKVWKDRLTALAEAKQKDDVLTFDQLGIDMLFVDEAHQFKNLYRFTRMTRVAGLPNSNSARAFDMELKTRFVMNRRRTESGVVFATGTPVSNSMAELWVMQHYLQPSTLAAAHVEHFDAWATTFGQVVTAIELAPDGSGYRMNSRFAKFVNLPELIGMFSEVADIRTADMLDLPVPDAKVETCTAKASEALKEYVETLVARSEKIHSGRVTPHEDNMLKVTGDGRRAALDMRLIDPTLPADPGGKIALCAMQVAELWKETEATRGTQLVFCDVSTPRAEFNAYDELRSQLERLGVPKAEIAFVHDYDADKAKARLFADVRAGNIRVLLGSTSRMGMGTNVQDRLVAEHHLDAPWRPSDVEQREGRIKRQGNSNATVRIFRYVTEGSFDAYMWQTLETKARFVAQVMSGNRGIRSAEDVELAALSYAEVKALASGNPKVLEKAGVDAEVVKLGVLKAQFERSQWTMRNDCASLPGQIERSKQLLAALEDDQVAARKALEANVLTTADGKPLADPKEQAAALEALRKTVRGDALRGTLVDVGQYGDFQVCMEVTHGRFGFAGEAEMVIALRRKAEHSHPIPHTGSFILTNMVKALESIPDRIVTVTQRIAREEAELEAARDSSAAKTFPQEAKLAALRERQQKLNVELGVYDCEHSGADDNETGTEEPVAAQAA